MNNQLMEELLNEEESSTLDFKRDHYPFDRATDEEKAELLKDILAFANAWRRTDAYILIGVEEVKGAPSKLVGVAAHIDDAKLQQFVNSKTQRPVEFSYQAFSFEGKQIGVLRIPPQQRPVYLTKDYGKLKKHVVYIRRGSSTGEAEPEEIARMGAVAVEGLSQPALELQFADVGSRKGLGPSISLLSETVEVPPQSAIPLVVGAQLKT
jgi:predicted HTH transcriptional regulator